MTTKHLERSIQNAVLGGVLAGLAKYFEQDPVLFRVIAIIIILFTGILPGALFYAIAWLIIPPETLPEAPSPTYTVVE